MLVDEDVRGAVDCELRCRDGKHVGAAAEAVSENEDAYRFPRGVSASGPK